jgi:glutamyl-tRNA synthetase
MTVVTRFAPSPTGFLHIGGVRTALFNWLYAKHHGGVYRLRIEDTDKKRSTQEAIDAIIEGLDWIGLPPDEEIVFQSQRQSRHAEVAQELLDKGLAYRCYCSPEELTEMRELAKAEGRPMRYDGRWRDRGEDEAPAGIDPVVRFKAPQEGSTTLDDQVQGSVTVQNSEMDDLVLLRADGSPTYMLSVIVDDHDMGVTHVIRGDDHLTNAFRQSQMIRALGWPVPVYAHIPLIHGQDGAKLSKRHGALGVEAYRDDGFLPEALKNYLLRLGWSHGDEEIISIKQAIEWFDLDSVGKGPSRFDVAKLQSVNAHYIQELDNDRAARLVLPLLAEKGLPHGEAEGLLLSKAMPGLKPRAKTLLELADAAVFYVHPIPLPLDAKAGKALNEDGKKCLDQLKVILSELSDWTEEQIDSSLRSFAESQELKLGQVFQPLRAALTGTMNSPSVTEVAYTLGQEMVIERINSCLTD